MVHLVIEARRVTKDQAVLRDLLARRALMVCRVVMAILVCPDVKERRVK